MRDDGKRERDQRHAANRPAWVAWYKRQAWRDKAKAQLRAEPHCRFCAQRGVTTPARIADHIKPHRGDHMLFWHGALQSLCWSCHSGLKQSMERGSKAGCDADGLPTDPSHPWA